MAPSSEDIRIELVSSEDDLVDFWDCMYQSFGIQTNDAYMLTIHPRMHTPEGRASAIAGLEKSWKTNGKDSTTKFWLKATVPAFDTAADDLEKMPRKIVGAAIWTEALQSRNPPSNVASTHMNLEEIYPGDESEQRFLEQVHASLYGHRVDVVKSSGEEGLPVVILELCCVQPSHQGKGIARKLTQWGLDLAKRQGDKYGVDVLECYTEGSVMGAPVYQRMGFQSEGEVVYVVDDEFKDRRTAPNTQLRRPRGLPV